MYSKLLRAAMTVTFMVVGACAALAPAAQAELTIEPGSFRVTTSSPECSRTASKLEFKDANCSEAGAEPSENEWGWEEVAEAQAGAHTDLTTSFKFLTNSKGEAGASLRHVQVELPPGFVGAPVAVPTCSPDQMIRETYGTACPVSAQIGTITTVINTGESGLPPIEYLVPVYNLVPRPGETALFAFAISGNLYDIAISVRPGDYGVTATVGNTPGSLEIISSSLTLWGVPAAKSHDAQRGEVCIVTFGFCPHAGGAAAGTGSNPLPFLTNASQCTSAPLTARLKVRSWQGSQNTEEATTPVGPMTGCERLQFDPTMSIAPTLSQADSPSGYTVGMDVPQNEGTEGLGTATLHDASVTLPDGTAISPSAATGLVGCQTTGPEGINIEGPESVEIDQYGDPLAARGKCPAASELGTVRITSPLVSEVLEGGLYLAQPKCGGAAQPECTPQDASDGELYGVYLEAEGAGAIIKLDGHVSVNPSTGQITTTFSESPQLPFSEFQLNFFGGPRSPLANPKSCGEAVMTSRLEPYSSLMPAEPVGTFTVTGCQAPSFAPRFMAGTASNQADGYSPLSVTFARQDLEGELGQVTVSTPPGLSGMLTHVTLCQEPEAVNGRCSSASQIGEVTASTGPGPDPFYVSGGKVYITGPYDGAPFGLSIVEPAVAGPFNLGNVVVRGAIHVDPQTAALTITSESLPTFKDGIPLQIKMVNVNINRPGFTFNPTDCDKMAITGTIASSEGASAAVSSPFQVTNCASLKFEPKLAASTSGKTSKADGASLTVKLTYPNTPQGSEANIAKVKVDLPKQLPSRLTTLQKACTAAVFDMNPANCPAASVVGHSKANTPIIPVPLEGPAYFVSHGGEAFPSLIMVLQGYGVTVDLVGTTFISKAGITSTTFKTVPDVPVGSFELNLPEEKYSALAANGDLCKSMLALPTAFVGQNGAEIHASTPLSVSGCKPELGIVRDSVKGTKATIVVSVPSAGKLLATGKGVSTGRGKAGKAGDVSVQVTLTKAEQAFLRKHTDRKLKAKINLRFTPRKGAKLTTSITILIA